MASVVSSDEWLTVLHERALIPCYLGVFWLRITSGVLSILCWLVLISCYVSLFSSRNTSAYYIQRSHPMFCRCVLIPCYAGACSSRAIYPVWSSRVINPCGHPVLYPAWPARVIPPCGQPVLCPPCGQSVLWWSVLLPCRVRTFRFRAMSACSHPVPCQRVLIPCHASVFSCHLVPPCCRGIMLKNHNARSPVGDTHSIPCDRNTTETMSS